MIQVESAYYPYLLMRVSGEPTERELASMFDATDAVSQLALEKKTRHVSISVGEPKLGARERKYIASRIAAMPKEHMSLSLGSFVVVESAAFRGVLTALRWLAPSLVSVDPVKSIDQALDAAGSLFAANAIRVEAPLRQRAKDWLEKHSPPDSKSPSFRSPSPPRGA
jgi:hypothetical protein